MFLFVLIGLIALGELQQINNNRAPHRYIGNAPVIAAGVAFPGYPAMGAHAANSGRDTGPRTRWGVTGTPAETEPRPKEKGNTSPLSPHALPSPRHRGPCAHQFPQVGSDGSMDRSGATGSHSPERAPMASAARYRICHPRTAPVTAPTPLLQTSPFLRKLRCISLIF